MCRLMAAMAQIVAILGEISSRTSSNIRTVSREVNMVTPESKFAEVTSLYSILYEMIFRRKSFHIFRNVGNESISKDELVDI